MLCVELNKWLVAQAPAKKLVSVFVVVIVGCLSNSVLMVVGGFFGGGGAAGGYGGGVVGGVVGGDGGVVVVVVVGGHDAGHRGPEENHREHCENSIITNELARNMPLPMSTTSAEGGLRELLLPLLPPLTRRRVLGEPFNVFSGQTPEHLLKLFLLLFFLLLLRQHSLLDEEGERRVVQSFTTREVRQ